MMNVIVSEASEALLHDSFAQSRTPRVKFESTQMHMISSDAQPEEGTTASILLMHVCCLTVCGDGYSSASREYLRRMLAANQLGLAQYTTTHLPESMSESAP